MKRVLIALLICMLITVPVMGASVTESTNVRVYFVNQDPDPVQPGEAFDLRLRISNTGSALAENVEVQIVPDYPIKLLPGQSDIQEVGNIGGLQKEESGYIVLYKMIIDNSAIEGDIPVTIKYRINGENWFTLEDHFTVRVETIDATVTIEKVSSEPSLFVPGEETKLKITLKNLADSYVRDVSFKLDLALNTITSSSSTATDVLDFLPFAPVSSATEKKIKQIAPGESIDLIFDIRTYPDAISKTYKIPVSLEYKDESDNSVSRTDFIGVVVGDDPELIFGLDNTEIYTKNKVGSVVVKAANIGVMDLKFLDITLQESEDYIIVESNDVYVGKLDSDDFETAEYRIFVKETSNGHVDLKYHLTYKDANNQDFEKDYTVPLKIYSDAEAKKLGLIASGGSGGLIMFLVIAISLGAYFWYRKKNKKKK